MTPLATVSPKGGYLPTLSYEGISDDCARQPGRQRSVLRHLPARTGVRKLRLVREESTSLAAFSLSACSDAELLSDYCGILHDREIEVFRADTLGRWRCGYLRGRLCAKLALKALADRLDLAQVHIERGVFGQPVVRHRQLANSQVSISHSGNWAVAVAFDETQPMATDIEVFSESKQAVIFRNMTAAEIDGISATNLNPRLRLTVLWTIKESLAKVLRSGLMSPFEVYTIERIVEKDGVVESTFRNFAQYKCLSFSLGDVAVSIALPKRTAVELGIANWASTFQLDSPRSPVRQAPS